VWHILLLDAVCRRHGVGWNARFTGRNFFHPVLDHRFYHSRRNKYDHPTCPARYHSRPSRTFDCHHDKEAVLRWLDVDISLLATHLERRLAHVCVLALRRFFSWGQTRLTQGETATDADHGDKKGEFDSSGIVMRRWVEFERERRWKSGTPSARNSYYDPRSSSPKRQSLVSTTERDSRIYDGTTVESSNYTQGSGSRSRHDSQQLLMLPAPLSVNRPSPSPMSVSRLSRTSEDAGGPDSSRQRLISSPQSADERHGYDTPDNSPSVPLSSRYASPTSAESSNNGALRPGRNSVETNPFVYSNSQRMVSEYDQVSPTADSEEYTNFSPSPSSQSHTQRTRGISLTDNGPVPGPDGVRRVSRKRQSQQSPPQNRYSRGSTYLPPGAAMPQPGGHGNAY